MRMSDKELEIFEQLWLQAIGVGRRDFLKVVGAMTAFCGLGFATRAHAAKPSGPSAGEKLAKDQTFRYGGGGWYQSDPSSHDFNKDLYCSGHVALFAGLMVFNADFVAEPWMASEVKPNKDGSVWTFTMRKDSRWSDNSPVTARDFEWSFKRQLNPETKAPYASFLYDIKNGEAFNKKQLTDASQVGVKALYDWVLEVTLEGPRGYFPVLAAYLAALPAHRGAVEKHGDKWTEAGNIVTNGPFTLEAWEHNKQMVLRKNPYYFNAKNVHLTRVVCPIIPVQPGALPYENNELDMTALQAGDLKRLQGDPRAKADVFQYPFPGTWYLIPQVTKPPFDNVKVRREVAHALNRDEIDKLSQGLAIPAWSMIPPIGASAAVQEVLYAEAARKSGAAMPAAAVGIVVPLPPASLSPAHLEYAALFLQTVPAAVRAATGEPFGAVALLYGMICSKDPEARARQIAKLTETTEPGIVSELNLLLPVIDKLDAGAFLPLGDLSIRALRGLSPDQYENFRSNLRQLIEADQQIDLFEYMLERMIVRHLDLHFRTVKRPPVQYSRLGPLIPDCAVVLSSLARIGQVTEAKALAAFQNGAAQLTTESGPVFLPLTD